MKTTPRLSGPVLAFGIVCFTITALVGWLAFKNRKPTADDAAPQTEVVAATPDEILSATETNELAAVPAYDLSQGIPPVIPVSLAALLVKAENDVWTTQPWVNYPRGLQKFCAVDFNIEGVLQIESAGSIGSTRNFRRSIIIPLTITNATEGEVTVSEIGTNIGCIHILGATRYSGYSIQGEKVAEVVWHYANGQQRRTPIEYAVHTRDWRRMRFESPDRVSHPGAKVVWRSDQRLESDRNMRLYHYALANPDPGHQIKNIEFVTAGTNPSLFLTALSLDPLPLGVRPDDSPDLEEVDPPAARSLQIFVQDSEGALIQGARIRAHYQQVLDGKSSFINKSLGTDANGSCMFKFPMLELDKLDLYVWHEGSEHTGKKMTWETSAGDIIPESYTFKLGNGITISGSVVDESEQPVVGAKLSFHHYARGDVESKRGEQVDFSWRSTVSDAQGGWQMKGVPQEFIEQLSINATHPEFPQVGLATDAKDTVIAQLRNGTHKLVMKRGLIVRGKVTDENDNPIEGAQVWAGERFSEARQDKKTDAKGEFRFTGIKEGAVTFSAAAKGRAPATKSVVVKVGMGEIMFRLDAGSLIRGVVRNEAGEAISGVRVVLEGDGNMGRTYEFSATTDKDGRFEWDGAPNEPQQFYIGKQGYEQKRGVTLKPAEENVVTLRKGRKVQGWVVDAETEKPITKFRAGAGQSHADDRFYANYPGMKEYSDPNGVFTLELSEEQVNAIKVEADDYAAKIEKLPAAANGEVQVTLRLKPSPALRGVLVNSQGAPVAGATVALTKGDAFSGPSLRLSKGRLNSYERNSGIVTTDAQGNFTLASPPETGGTVVASAESGFASASVDQVRSSGRLVLQEFGRIEGTIKVAGAPAAGHEFSFSMMNRGISTEWDTYKSTSDEQGRFSFNKVPPGEGSVVRLIKTSPNSWAHSHNTTVMVESGKITRVSFGEDGAVIKGQVRMEVPPGENEPITFGGNLNTKMPAFNQDFATPEEANAFYRSDEWKEWMKQMKHFGVAVNADGSFSLDSIPPGEYTLTISANKPGTEPWRHEPVATGSTTITVPDSASPYAPIGISDLILRAVKK